MYSGDIEDWKSLAGCALEPNVFLEPAFALAAAQRFGGGELIAVRVHAGARLVGILPGRIEGIGAGRPISTFVAWTHPFAPLSTPLIHRDFAREAVGAFLDFLPALPGTPRLALFPLFAEDGAVARFAVTHLTRAGRAPVRLGPHRRAALAPGKTHPAMRERKELRRQRRRLAEAGTVDRRTVSQTSQMGAAIADYLELEASGWKGRSDNAALHDADIAQFLTRSVSALAAEGKARVDFLLLDGRAIAATIVLYSGDRAWFWKTAYDEAYARYSPGVQLALDLTEALESDRRLSLADSCAVADHPMIDRLWGERLAVADWLVPLAGPGSLAAGLAAERIRRSLRNSLKAMRNRLREKR
jgi:CelD/BcsL family acetyltransferase involved in cellulose biosynthesis